MLHGHTLKSVTSDYDQRHVIAFRPISIAARSWSYDKSNCCIVDAKIGTEFSTLLVGKTVVWYLCDN